VIAAILHWMPLLIGGIRCAPRFKGKHNSSEHNLFHAFVLG
jgi:hypothetical protein